MDRNRIFGTLSDAGFGQGCGSGYEYITTAVFDDFDAFDTGVGESVLPDGPSSRVMMVMVMVTDLDEEDMRLGASVICRSLYCRAHIHLCEGRRFSPLFLFACATENMIGCHSIWMWTYMRA